MGLEYGECVMEDCMVLMLELLVEDVMIFGLCMNEGVDFVVWCDWVIGEVVREMDVFVGWFVDEGFVEMVGM